MKHKHKQKKGQRYPGHNAHQDYIDCTHPLNCLNWRMKYLRHKCQAKYRKEEFDMTYEEFLDIWYDSNHWNRARRSRNCYQMRRISIKEPWCKDNIEIVKNHWLSQWHHKHIIQGRYILGRYTVPGHIKKEA